MLRKKKRSLKDLENKISSLEKENKTLKKYESKIHETEVVLESLSQYLNVEQIDIFSYNKEEDRFYSLDFSSQLNVLKVTPENFEGFLDIIPYEDHENFKAGFSKVTEKAPFRYQGKIFLKKGSDKETKPVEIIVLNITSNISTISIKDITLASKQKRELTRIKEKIDESDKLKSILLANISHQIRTPLNSITGFSELLAGSETNMTTRKEYIEIIKRQSKRILHFIDNIAEISKLESGEIIISKTPCNPNLILNELLIGVNQQRPQQRRETVQLLLNTPDKENLEILTDSGRLQQALLNIINFCLQYTHQGKIEFGYLLEKENKKLEFFIHDTSDGLTKEEQKVVFNRFMVIESMENTKMEDPGLGLTIARDTIKALGGKIWVESEKGKGTSFYFSIPYEPTDTNKTPTSIDDEELEEEEVYNFANKVILIVDDEEVNAMFLDAVFQGTGVQTIFAKNGLQALELIKNISKIDLILMDLKMPLMDGIVATREIRKINQGIPIIAQTALASELDIAESQVAGCNDIVTKPIEVAELLKLVNSYLTV
jgi:signal transduction histidine kinase/CheY-like chemotaxis protein